MKRMLLILAAITVAGGIAAAPAVAGLAGNPSFGHQITVPVPSKAMQPQFADDHGRDGTGPASAPASRATQSRSTHPEPGDDRGGVTPHAEPADDHGGVTPHAEPADDHGGVTPHAEPADDRGGVTPHAEPTDDHGGHGGRG
jgi:hypothetical protein